MSMDFNIALSGMSAAQKGIRVSTMNISNMSTVGYVRERLNLIENGAATGGGKSMKIGSGVSLKDIQRMADERLNNNYNGQNSNVGYFNTIGSVLSEVETVMGDYTIGGLSKLMGNFFNAWTEFAKYPEESSYRYALVGESVKFVQKINEMGSELGRIKESAIEDANIQVSEVNTILNGLSEINRRINESGENVSNSLLNERDRKIQELSSYMSIETTFESDNPNVVTIRSGGAYLVDKQRAYDISLKQSDTETFLSNGGTKIELSSGSIKANLDVADIYLDKYTSMLNKFTQELINQVNTIHSAGYSIGGDTGLDFFVGTNAKDIAINPLLQADASKIASSSASGVSGNTDVAKGISQIVNSTVDLNMDFRNYVSSFSMNMAQDLNTVINQTIIHEQVLGGMGERKANLEGVNLEEEMANLMMYQKYFNANAKSIKIMTELLDSLFQMT